MAPNWAIGVAVGLGTPIGLYATFILLGSVPFFQRHFLYAHKLNTLFWHDLDNPEYWGFARSQVTPFSIETADGESLYSWLILPLGLYLDQENELRAQPAGFSEDISKSKSFQLLKSNPQARLVIYFHGNAGHIAQVIRPDAYHTLTDTSTYFLLAIDYRGFGKSTGRPTEAGLIRDGVAAVDWAMQSARIDPSRVVIIGQSLGTAVASGVAEHFATKGVEFAGVILVAGFSSLPVMLGSYAAGGIIPVLSPFRVMPPLLRLFQSFIVDKWESAQRLANLVAATQTRLRLVLVHAKDDAEIPCHESDVLFESAARATIEGAETLDSDGFRAWKMARTQHRDRGTFVTVATGDRDIMIREEVVPYGGHNNVLMSAAVPLAVMRCFEKTRLATNENDVREVVGESSKANDDCALLEGLD